MKELKFKNLYNNLENIFKYIKNDTYVILFYNKNSKKALYNGIDYTINIFIDKKTMICEIEEGPDYKNNKS